MQKKIDKNKSTNYESKEDKQIKFILKNYNKIESWLANKLQCSTRTIRRMKQKLNFLLSSDNNIYKISHGNKYNKNALIYDDEDFIKVNKELIEFENSIIPEKSKSSITYSDWFEKISKDVKFSLSTFYKRSLSSGFL
ncbi:hypothetical protein [Mycoplasma sp. OR1901]|uniref:hypothetical protein n=1 Tax=Mycoplasma sp. OR1901 TaxID=2742195 RepID=UPI0015832D51|nr:hypothetical protein [Mycoplasma sp. OR1901]QKT05562.1 hypothetical protein HTZ87_02500 [Mycoplasma sp. OR1901]